MLIRNFASMVMEFNTSHIIVHLWHCMQCGGRGARNLVCGCIEYSQPHTRLLALTVLVHRMARGRYRKNRNANSVTRGYGVIAV